MDASCQDPAPDPVARIDTALGALLRARRALGHDVGGPMGGSGRHAGVPRGPRGFAMARLLEHLESAEDRGQEPGIGELAEAIGVDQPRASRLVADAVSRGYAVRQTDARDARRSIVRITDAGRAHLQHTRARRRAAVEAALADFTVQDARTLADLLDRLERAWPRG